MLNLLADLHARGGMTLIMVSHSMNDVARLCSRIMVMNRGELVMDAAPEEIFRQGARLREMGLGLPEAAQLCEALRERGFDLPEGVWRLSQLEKLLPAP